MYASYRTSCLHVRPIRYGLTWRWPPCLVLHITDSAGDFNGFFTLHYLAGRHQGIAHPIVSTYMYYDQYRTTQRSIAGFFLFALKEFVVRRIISKYYGRCLTNKVYQMILRLVFFLYGILATATLIDSDYYSTLDFSSL